MSASSPATLREEIRAQLAHFLDFEAKANPARMRNNLDWLGGLALVDFLRDIGKHFSVNQLMAKESAYALIRLPSGEVRKVHVRCRATVGRVGNTEHGNVKLGKAGRSRHLGRRPKVRGIAMNPVDHPHGGGEGSTAGGRHPVTPWGVPTKGKRTRNNKASDKFIVKRRR